MNNHITNLQYNIISLSFVIKREKLAKILIENYMLSTNYVNMIPKDMNNFRFESGNKIKYALILELETIWGI
jgi:hypothetical protein